MRQSQLETCWLAQFPTAFPTSVTPDSAMAGHGVQEVATSDWAEYSPGEGSCGPEVPAVLDQETRKNHLRSTGQCSVRLEVRRPWCKQPSETSSLHPKSSKTRTRGWPHQAFSHSRLQFQPFNPTLIRRNGRSCCLSDPAGHLGGPVSPTWSVARHSPDQGPDSAPLQHYRLRSLATRNGPGPRFQQHTVKSAKGESSFHPSVASRHCRPPSAHTCSDSSAVSIPSI
jgi:hypothetical protein